LMLLAVQVMVFFQKHHYQLKFLQNSKKYEYILYYIFVFYQRICNFVGFTNI
jgi:hypothetical protein